MHHQHSELEYGEWMSPSEAFPPQEFVYVNCTMSAFPLVPLRKCQSRLKVNVQINSPCRKSFFFLPFLPLSSAYITFSLTKEC